MKTLNGITFAQLNNFTAEELNEYFAIFATNQVREAMSASGMPVEFMEKYLAVALPKMRDLFNEKLGDKCYDFMRLLYDTEEKFNAAADLMTEMGNVGIMCQKLTSDIVTELIENEK